MYHLHINVFLFIYFGDASCCKCPSRSLRSSRQSSSELHSDRPWLKVSEKDKKSEKEKHENRKANKCWNFQGILVKVQKSTILSNKWPSLMASMPKKRKEDRGYTQAPKAGEYASLTNCWLQSLWLSYKLQLSYSPLAEGCSLGKPSAIKLDVFLHIV